MKHILCPHCFSACRDETEYSVSVEHGMICLKCEKVIFPITDEQFASIAKPKFPIITGTGYQNQYCQDFGQ